jgi:hypothetical protein
MFFSVIAARRQIVCCSHPSVPQPFAMLIVFIIFSLLASIQASGQEQCTWRSRRIQKYALTTRSEKVFGLFD